jgi:hypothetical protein
VVAKRLALLHELVPKAVRVAVLFNPANVGRHPSSRRDLCRSHSTWREAGRSARAVSAEVSDGRHKHQVRMLMANDRAKKAGEDARAQLTGIPQNEGWQASGQAAHGDQAA